MIAKQQQLFDRCVSFIRMYSVLSIVLSLSLFYHLFNIEIDPNTGQAREYSWIFKILRDLNAPIDACIIAAFTLTAAGGVALYFFPNTKSIRIVHWLASVFAVGVPINMIPAMGVPGGPDLRYLGWVWVNFILLFLPENRNRGKRHRQSYIYVTWGAISSVLLFYSIAGISKFILLIEGAIRGPLLSYIPNYPSCVLESSFLFRSPVTKTLVTQFFIDHNYLGFLGFLAVTLLETVSFPLAFFPKFHRPLGISLILFHLFMMPLVKMNFFPLMAVVAFLLLLSPFAPNRPFHFLQNLRTGEQGRE